MDRRKLLKMAAGGAAGTAVLFSPRLGVHRSRAQAPAYAAEVIYEFTEFLGEKYDPTSDGRILAVNSSGLITGRDVVDGKAVPCTWDLTGTRTALAMGTIAYGIAGFLLPVSESGNVAASLYVGDDFGSQRMGVTWRDGIPELVPGNAADENVDPWGINDAGVLVGAAGDLATRWVGSDVQ